MSFVHLFGIGYFSFILNFEKVFEIEAAVLLSKGLLLAAAIQAVLTRRADKASLALTAALLILILFSAAMTDNPYFQWFDAIKALNNVVIPLMLLAIEPRKGDREPFLLYIAGGAIFCVFMGGVYQVIGRYSLVGLAYDSGDVRLQGSLIPAFLAAIALNGLVASLMLWDGSKDRYLGLVAANGLILLLTMARMPLALGALLTATYILWHPRISSAYKIVLSLSGVVVVGVFLIVFGEAILERFSTATASGREILWPYFMEVAEMNWRFGIGIGHITTVVPHDVAAKVGSVVAPHNEFIRVAAEIGIIQAAIFMLIYAWIMLAAGFRSSRFLGMHILICVAFFIFCYTDNAMLTPTSYPLLPVAIFGLFRFGARVAGRPVAGTHAGTRLHSGNEAPTLS